MARHVVGAMLLVVAVIHLLPLVGVLGGMNTAPPRPLPRAPLQ